MSVTNQLLCVATALCASQCLAQPSTGPKLATHEEYRWCLDEDDQIRPLDQELRRRGREHEAALKATQDEMNAHVAQQDKLDAYDKEAVDSFNRKLAAINERGDALNKEAEDFNTKMKAFNLRVAAANRRCAGLVIPQRVKEAVQKERAAKASK